MEQFGWQGEKVRLVPFDKAKHFDNYLRWLNDARVTQTLIIGDEPLTREAQEAWFERMCADSQTVYFVIESLAGEHLGTTALHDINFKHGTATSGTFLGDPATWGRGFGSDAVKVRTRYAFEVLNLRLLLSCALEGNEASLKMQTSAGYFVCGRIPGRYWKRGRYVDEILTCCTRESWLAAQV